MPGDIPVRNVTGPANRTNRTQENRDDQELSKSSKARQENVDTAIKLFGEWSKAGRRLRRHDRLYEAPHSKMVRPRSKASLTSQIEQA